MSTSDTTLPATGVDVATDEITTRGKAQIIRLDLGTADAGDTRKPLSDTDTGRLPVGGAALGAPGDAPAASDVGAASLLQLVKRGLQNWTTLLARIPALISGRLPVDVQFPGTQPVSLSTLPLPSGAATQLTLAAVQAAAEQTRDAIKNSIDLTNTVWTDNSGAFFVRRDRIDEGTGTITVQFTLADGTNATPGAGLRPAASTDREVAQTLFEVITAGTGYAIGDLVAILTVIDVNAEMQIVATLWRNLTQGTTILPPTPAHLERADESVLSRQAGAWSMTVLGDPATSALQTVGNTALTTLVGRTPVLGARLPAATASPVVLSSDDVLDLVITGAANQLALNNNVLLAVAGAGWIDMSQYRSLAFTITPAAGTVTAGTLVFEQSTNGTDVVALPLFDSAAPNTAPVTTYNPAAATPRHFEGPIKHRFARVRVSVAVTGTTTGLQATSIARMAPYVVSNAQQSILQSGTLTTVSTVSNVAAIAAGANAIGDTGMQYRANATGAASTLQVVSAATTNATIVKASAGRLLGWSLANTTASWRYVKLHNQTTAPTAGTGVVRTISIPPNGLAQLHLPGGAAFTTGIGITIVTGSATTDATAVALGDVVGNLDFA
jgi:hypothetical protein